MKLNEKAINEITYLLNEVKEVVKYLESCNIYITSDPWTATSFSDKEDILTWTKKDFQNIKNINPGNKFYIGGNVVTGNDGHKYKEFKHMNAPKELAIVQGQIFEKYLKKIIKKSSLKYFTLKFKDEFGLVNNCGWEHFLTIEATVKKTGLIDIEEEKIIEKDLSYIKDHIHEWVITYDLNEKEYRINGDYIEDFFWYGDEYITITHPKRLRKYIIDYIETYITETYIIKK